ncbi:hypothetical protein C4J97_4016 [Pseudomonas orientalis]|nr:hypothetical protein C4J97_4016 [Pseudomonas orientalis]
MLAKNVNEYAGFLNERGACKFFASKLAPTEGPPPTGDLYSKAGNQTCPDDQP